MLTQQTDGDADQAAEIDKSYQDLVHELQYVAAKIPDREDLAGLIKQGPPAKPTLEYVNKLIDTCNIVDVPKLVASLRQAAIGGSGIRGQEVAVFLGMSGCGKSTTMRFLGGVDYKSHFEPVMLRNVVVEDGDIPQALVDIKTSSKQESQTKTVAPRLFAWTSLDGKRQLVVCDSPGYGPGSSATSCVLLLYAPKLNEPCPTRPLNSCRNLCRFQDSQGGVVDIVNNYAIANALLAAESLRPVLLISRHGFADRGVVAFVDLAEHLNKAFNNNLAKFVGKFTYIFTCGWPTELTKDMLATFFDNLKRSIAKEVAGDKKRCTLHLVDDIIQKLRDHRCDHGNVVDVQQPARRVDILDDVHDAAYIPIQPSNSPFKAFIPKTAREDIQEQCAFNRHRIRYGLEHRSSANFLHCLLQELEFIGIILSDAKVTREAEEAREEVAQFILSCLRDANAKLSFALGRHSTQQMDAFKSNLDEAANIITRVLELRSVHDLCHPKEPVQMCFDAIRSCAEELLAAFESTTAVDSPEDAQRLVDAHSTVRVFWHAFEHVLATSFPVQSKTLVQKIDVVNTTLRDVFRVQQQQLQHAIQEETDAAAACRAASVLRTMSSVSLFSIAAAERGASETIVSLAPETFTSLRAACDAMDKRQKQQLHAVGILYQNVSNSIADGHSVRGVVATNDEIVNRLAAWCAWLEQLSQFGLDTILHDLSLQPGFTTSLRHGLRTEVHKCLSSAVSKTRNNVDFTTEWGELLVACCAADHIISTVKSWNGNRSGTALNLDELLRSWRRAQSNIGEFLKTTLTQADSVLNCFGLELEHWPCSTDFMALRSLLPTAARLTDLLREIPRDLHWLSSPEALSLNALNKFVHFARGFVSTQCLLQVDKDGGSRLHTAICGIIPIAMGATELGELESQTAFAILDKHQTPEAKVFKDFAVSGLDLVVPVSGGAQAVKQFFAEQLSHHVSSLENISSIVKMLFGGVIRDVPAVPLDRDSLQTVYTTVVVCRDTTAVLLALTRARDEYFDDFPHVDIVQLLSKCSTFLVATELFAAQAIETYIASEKQSDGDSTTKTGHALSRPCRHFANNVAELVIWGFVLHGSLTGSHSCLSRTEASLRALAVHVEQTWSELSALSKTVVDTVDTFMSQKSAPVTCPEVDGFVSQVCPVLQILHEPAWCEAHRFFTTAEANPDMVAALKHPLAREVARIFTTSRAILTRLVRDDTSTTENGDTVNTPVPVLNQVRQRLQKDYKDTVGEEATLDALPRLERLGSVIKHFIAVDACVGGKLIFQDLLDGVDAAIATAQGKVSGRINASVSSGDFEGIRTIVEEVQPSCSPEALQHVTNTLQEIIASATKELSECLREVAEGSGEQSMAKLLGLTQKTDKVCVTFKHESFAFAELTHPLAAAENVVCQAASTVDNEVSGRGVNCRSAVDDMKFKTALSIMKEVEALAAKWDGSSYKHSDALSEVAEKLQELGPELRGHYQQKLDALKGTYDKKFTYELLRRIPPRRVVHELQEADETKVADEFCGHFEKNFVSKLAKLSKLQVDKWTPDELGFPAYIKQNIEQLFPSRSREKILAATATCEAAIEADNNSRRQELEVDKIDKYLGTAVKNIRDRGPKEKQLVSSLHG